MKDGYNREISYMRLSLTDRCNFRCKYCMPKGYYLNSRELTYDELYDICVCAVELGIKKIRLTGGEPLLRDDIVGFCKLVSNINGLEELTLTTNGSLLAKYCEALKLAGVSRINISLDTLKSNRFKALTGVDKFADVINGIETAKNIGFKQIKINVVLMKNINLDEISDFVELTKKDNVSIRFIELMPIGNYLDYNNLYVPADIVLESEPELKLIKTNGVAQIYQKPGYLGTVGLIKPMSQKFCDMCNRIRVTSDGKIKPCLHSSDEYDLIGLKGDKLKLKFLEAINNKPNSHILNETCFSSSSRYMNQIGG